MLPFIGITSTNILIHILLLINVYTYSFLSKKWDELWLVWLSRFSVSLRIKKDRLYCIYLTFFNLYFIYT